MLSEVMLAEVLRSLLYSHIYFLISKVPARFPRRQNSKKVDDAHTQSWCCGCLTDFLIGHLTSSPEPVVVVD